MLAAALTIGLLYERSERDDVSEYIEQVNKVQRSSATRFGSINQAYDEFALSPATVDEQLPQLREASRMITGLRVRVERIEAPVAARELRKRLLEYFEQQELVAKELVAVVAYLPKLDFAERSVARANVRLRRSLRESGGNADVAAVTAYARRLRATANTLDKTEAPRLLAPARDAYVKQLRRYAAAATRLQRAVDANDAEATRLALQQLQNAAAPSRATARAQRAAIESYNFRVERINLLAAAVEKERRRLDAEVD